jgi:DNA-binding transcriptional LysR family regulator
MDFRQLEMFLAVADTLSFTKAGETLHVAQSAISRKIKMLEEELGENLFIRTGKRIALAPAGEVMVRYARQAFRELRHASMEVAEISQLSRGTVRIAGNMTACMYMLPPVIEKFRALFPRIDVQVVTGSAETTIPQVRNNTVDVVVSVLPVEVAELDVTVLCTEEMVVAASPEHQRLAGRRTVDVRDLADEPLIVFRRGTHTRTLIDDFLRNAGVAPPVAMESENVATIKPLVARGIGISLLPLPAVHDEQARGELRVAHLRGRPLVREIGLVTLRADYQPKALRELIKIFRKSFGPAPPSRR